MTDKAPARDDAPVNLSMTNGSAAKVQFPGCKDVVDVLTLLQDNDWVTAHDITFVTSDQQTAPRVFLNTLQIVTFALAKDE